MSFQEGLFKNFAKLTGKHLSLFLNKVATLAQVFSCEFYGIFKNTRDGSRNAAPSKIEHLVIIVNGWKPLTIITRSSILDVAAALDPPLTTFIHRTPLVAASVL